MSSFAIMQMLQDKVPLTLLVDLSDAEPVESTEILRHEPADAGWLTDWLRPSRIRRGSTRSAAEAKQL